LRFENFVVARFAFLVAVNRHSHVVGLFSVLLFESFVREERIGDFAEGGEDGLLVTQLGFFPSSFGLPVR